MSGIIGSLEFWIGLFGVISAVIALIANDKLKLGWFDMSRRRVANAKDRLELSELEIRSDKTLYEAYMEMRDKWLSSDRMMAELSSRMQAVESANRAERNREKKRAELERLKWVQHLVALRDIHEKCTCDAKELVNKLAESVEPFTRERVD